MGAWGSAVSSPSTSGAEPQPKSNLVYYSIKIWDLHGGNATVYSFGQQRSISRTAEINFYCAMHFSAERGLAIACRLSVRLSVCPSVTLVICDHISWKSWKLIAQTISPPSSLFVAKRRSTYSQGNMGKFGEIRGGVGKKWRAGEQKRQYLWNA